MSSLLVDVRYAFRRLIHRPGLALLAVLALALGIGLTATMFSIVNGVMLRGLPFEEPWELMSINRINPSEGPNRLIGRIHDYRDVIERQSTFDGIAAIWADTANVSAPGEEPQLFSSATVTANLFPLLGVQPVLGRAFTEQEEVPGGPPVVVLGDRVWRERFGGDPSVIGTTIRVDGTPTTILGVMPAGFAFPVNQQMWRPLRVDEQQIKRGDGPPIQMFGRLADGVSIAQGQSDLSRIMEQLGREYPDTNEGMSLISRPYVREVIGYQVPPFLFTMLAAVSLVLVIACANVANLLLARASARTRDVAVATALGAGRSRVALQLLIEASMIAAAGAALGVGLAKVGIDLFNGALASIPGGAPFWFRIGLDPYVLGFVLLLTVMAATLSGLIPAIRASGTDVNEILKDSSRGGSSLRIGRLSRSLVILEVALSCALLVGAGLMVRSITNMANEQYAFNEKGLFTATVALPPAGYPDADSYRLFYRALSERLRQLPGVTDASVATNLPVIGFDNGRFALEGETYAQDQDYPSARIGAVDAEYFATLQVPALSGRLLQASDNEDSMPVVVVNQSFAQTYYPEQSAIGKRLSIRAVLTTGMTARNDDIWYSIVGVVPDLYLDAQLFILSKEAIYAPMAQRPASAASLLVRTGGDPLELTASVRGAVVGIDPDLPIAAVNSLEAAIDTTQFFLRIFSVMFMIFGAAALFLATIGLYGVLAFSVAQRTHEVGLRVALGATPADVRRLVMRQGMAQLGIGLAIGMLLAALLGQGLTIALYQVSRLDPLVFTGIAVVLVLTGLAAAYLPARRATRVDPLVAMRAD